MPQSRKNSNTADSIMEMLPTEIVAPLLETAFYRLARGGRHALVKLARHLCHNMETGLWKTAPLGKLAPLSKSTIALAVGFLLAEAFLRWLARRDQEGEDLGAIIIDTPARAPYLPDQPTKDTKTEDRRKPHSGLSVDSPEYLAKRFVRLPHEVEESLSEHVPAALCNELISDAVNLCGLSEDGSSKELLRFFSAVTCCYARPTLLQGQFVCGDDLLSEGSLHIVIMPDLSDEASIQFLNVLSSLWSEAFYLWTVALYEMNELDFVKPLQILGQDTTTQ